jgi:branched-chain amino acid transport system substrate-binding protein
MDFMIVAVEESDSSVGFYDPDTGAEIANVRVGLWPHEIAIDTERELAYVSNFGIKDYDEHIGTPGCSISAIDLSLFAETGRFYTFNDGDEYHRRAAPHSVVIDAKRQRLLVNVEAEDTLLRFDLDSGAVATLIDSPATTDWDVDGATPLPRGTHTMLLSADGDRLYLGCGPNGLFEVDAATGAVIRSLNCGGAVRGLAFSQDGKQLIVSAGGEVAIVDPATFLVVRRYAPGWPAVRQFLYPHPTPDGRFLLVPAVWEGQLVRFDLETGEASRITVGADPIQMTIPPGSDFAYLGHGRSRFISKIDWQTFREVGRIATRGGPNGLKWAPKSEMPERKRLSFGAAIPLSGPSSSEGQDLRLGYQYWAELVNAAGGMICDGEAYYIDIMFADTCSVVGRADEKLPDGTPARDHLTRLAESLCDAGCTALLGSYPSPPHFALRDVTTARKIPLVTASGAASDIYGAGSKFVFGLMTTAKGFLNASFDLLARQQPRPQRVAFIACKDNAATEDALTTAQYIEDALGMTVVGRGPAGVSIRDRIIPFNHNETDYRAVVREVALLAPDVIAVTGHLGESMALTRELAAQEVEAMAVIFSVGPAMPDFAARLGPMAAYMMGSAMWSPSQDSYGHDRFATPQGFRDAFFERFSKEPSHLAAGAMACGLVIEEAVRRSGSIESGAIAAVLGEGFAMQCFYSPIRLDANGLNAGRPLLTIQLRGTDQKLRAAPLWPPALTGKLTEAATWPFPGWTLPSQHHGNH